MFIKKIAAILLVSFTVHAHAIELQRAQNWCWAASVQDVLAQVQIYESQERIAQRLLGWPYDRPAHVSEVVALFNSYGLTAWPIAYPASVQQLRETLATGWRIVALARPNGGNVGHFIVLQATDGSGNVTVSDPATGMTNSYPIGVLYARWRWEGSVIVGQPKPMDYYQRFNKPSARMPDVDNPADSEDKPQSNQTTPYGYKKPAWAD
jgi:hypothetical protein